MKRFTDEFTDSQIDRLDEIDNAAYNFACILTELSSDDCGENESNDVLEWDMSYIGEILYYAAAVLLEHGYRVRYPFRSEDSDGNVFTCDYLDEER